MARDAAGRGGGDGRGPGKVEPVVAFGGPVVAQIERLRALVLSELSPADAAFFATPPSGGGTWSSAGGQRLVPIAGLDAPRRAQLERAHEAATARLRGLAERLEQRGEAGRVAAHILRCALVVPTGIDGRHTDGTNPVLAFWGMARPGQELPSFAASTGPAGASAAPTAAAAGAPSARAAVPPAAADGAAAGTTEPPTGLPTERRTGSSLLLLAWAVPLALTALALWLLVQLLQPLPPVIVERPAPAPPPAADPTVEPASRVALLEQALAEARGLADRLADACVLAPERVETAPPLPPADVVEAPAGPPRGEVAVAPEPPALPAPRPRDVPPPVARQEPAPSLPPVTATPPTAAPSPSVCDPGWRPGRTPRVIFVVDGSGSMREAMPGAGSRMEASKQAIGRVTRALHPAIEVGMVSFSHCGATSRSRFYAHPERGAFLGQVQALTPQRATSLAASIARAGATAPRTSEVVMVVVSDGEDTCGGDPCAAARQARAQKPNLTINVIDLGGGAGAGVLQCVASAGGGRVFTPRDASQMNANLQRATGQADASGCP
jgi:hypothetical protein